jgi:hypothetical protein
VVLRQLGKAPKVVEARVVAEPMLGVLVVARAAQAPIFAIEGDPALIVHAGTAAFEAESRIGPGTRVRHPVRPVEVRCPAS